MGRLVENGGGSADGLQRLNIASFSDEWGSVCMCFVVDAAEHDAEKIQEGKELLRTLAQRQPRKPIVVAATKCDVDGAMSASEVFDVYSLQGIGEERLLKVVAVTASCPTTSDRSDLCGSVVGQEELLQFFLDNYEMKSVLYHFVQIHY